MSISPPSIRKLYLAAGLTWGLICGFAVAYVVGAGAAGLAWIFVFGDNAWPGWAWTSIHTLMVVTGLPAFGLCLYAGWYCSRRSRLQGADQAAEARKAVIALASSLAVLLGFGLFQSDVGLNARHLKRTSELEYRRYLEDSSPERKRDETDVEFYCRVIRHQSKIGISYRGDTLKIVPEALATGNGLLFAVVGPYDKVRSLADELSLYRRVASGTEALDPSPVVLPEHQRCGRRMYFIRMGFPPGSSSPRTEVEARVPSHGLGFTIKIRNGDQGNPDSTAPPNRSSPPPTTAEHRRGISAVDEQPCHPAGTRVSPNCGKLDVS